jgi:hypothetical protein
MLRLMAEGILLGSSSPVNPIACSPLLLLLFGMTLSFLQAVNRVPISKRVKRLLKRIERFRVFMIE